MFNPWIGSRYEKQKTLLLLESVYDWIKDGITYSPEPNHPSQIVEDAFTNPLQGSYTMITMNRAICGRADPTPEQAADRWHNFALAEYIPVSVGSGSAARPSPAHWRQAEQEWPALLGLLRPRTVIVLGRTMWSWMPKTQEIVNDYVQGYALDDGEIAMCFATYHPSPRAGRDWRFFADFIADVERQRHLN